MTIVTNKKISKIRTNHPKITPQSKTRLLQQFLDEGEHEVEEIEIALKPHSPYEYGNIGGHAIFSIPKQSLESLSNSFGSNISEKDIKRIFAEIVAVMQNPESVAKHLKSLDEAIGTTIAPLEYSEADLPQYLIPARGYFIPGPPPENYQPRNQGRSLDQELLRREKDHGINTEGFTPKFVGLINRKKANKFINEGHLFSEDAQVQNLLLHSKYSHRLHHEIIRNAAQTGEINLSIGNGKTLSQRELLILLTTYTTRGFSLWDSLIDSLDDSMIPAVSEAYLEYPLSSVAYKNFIARENSYSVENFSYSSRSPFTINSLIACFGADLNLPNLQHYLLNSHWKEAAQMVEKAREIIKEDNGAAVNASKYDPVESWNNFLITPFPKLAGQIYNESGNELRKLRNRLLARTPDAETPAIASDFSSLYTSCMKSLATIGYINPGIILPSPLTTSPQQAEKSTKYQPYQQETRASQTAIPEFLRAILPSLTQASSDNDKGIKKKTSEPKPLGRTHESMDAYAAEKFRIAKEQQPKPQPTKFSLRSLYQRPRVSPATPTATFDGGASR